MKDSTMAAGDATAAAALDAHHSLRQDHERLTRECQELELRLRSSGEQRIRDVVEDLRAKAEEARQHLLTCAPKDLVKHQVTVGISEETIALLEGAATRERLAEKYDEKAAFEAEHALLLGLVLPKNGNGAHGKAQAAPAPEIDRRSASAGERDEADAPLACVRCGHGENDHAHTEEDGPHDGPCVSHDEFAGDCACEEFVTPEGRPAVDAAIEKKLREAGFVPCVPRDESPSDFDPAPAGELLHEWRSTDHEGARAGLEIDLRALGWERPKGAKKRRGATDEYRGWVKKRVVAPSVRLKVKAVKSLVDEWCATEASGNKKAREQVADRLNAAGWERESS